MDGSTKQRKGLRQSHNWPQVGPTGPEESLILTLAFRFWSFHALLWCIMSDLRSCRGVGQAYLGFWKEASAEGKSTKGTLTLTLT